MPCRSDYLEPSAREKESVKVLRYLAEDFNQPTAPHDIYGIVGNLDSDTAKLCALCRKHGVEGKSLELQIWWRDHQKMDAEREKNESERAKREFFRQRGIAKLTPQERKALGV